MIMLNSISGKEFCLNSDLIYKMEEKSDTIITLVDGKTIRVSNEIGDIIDRIVEYKRRIHTNFLEGNK